MPRRSSRRSSRTLAFLAAALALGLGAAEPATKSTTHIVVMEAVSFRPAVVTVRVGDSVVWQNKDLFPHTATAPAFDSKIIAVDRSWRYVARAQGEYSYVCALHPTMKGTLRVR